MNYSEAVFVNTLKAGSKIHGVFEVLKDKQWHCRECEYVHLNITQIAGESGIQGLQRGTKSRPGIEIDSGKRFCVTCERSTHQDRWTGQIVEAIPTGTMPLKFLKRTFTLLGERDIIEQTARPIHQITIDHKLPRLRWTSYEAENQQDYSDTVSDDEIRQRFQILKKSNGSVSHNLLKSRSCESCYKTGERGKPFGISFFYEDNSIWKPKNKKDPSGCIGCGWYDFDKWREELNKRLATVK